VNLKSVFSLTLELPSWILKAYSVWRWSFLRESPYIFLELLGPECKGTTIPRNVGIYLPTANGVASRKTELLTWWFFAAAQTLSLACCITAITNATLQLGRWFWCA